MYKDQLFQYGGVPVTSGRPIGMFADTIIFVDGTNGSDDNTGKRPNRAVATLSKALTLITTKGGVIYIRPKTRSGSDPGYYSEAATLTLGTHDDISIIGVGAAGGMNPNGAFMTQIKGSTAASPIINCLATGVTIENIDFNRGDTTTGGIKLYDDSGTTAYNLGNSISNCHFRNLRGSAAASTGAAIIVDGGIFPTINNNFFYANRCGILLKASTSVIQGIIIKNNMFVGEGDATPESAIDADIYGASLTCYQMIIDNNLFAHDVPSYATSADATAYIYITGGTRGLISNNTFQTDDLVISATPTSTDEVYVPDEVLVSNNHDASGTDPVPA